MTPQPDTPPPDRSSGPWAWARPAALVLACLVIGFVAGWVVRGDEGPVTVLAPPTTSEDAGAGPDRGGATTPGTTTAQEEPEPPPPRERIALAVLNGTDVDGAAGRAAEQAQSLGYRNVTAGNAPTADGPSVVYFRSGQRPAAERVAGDLEVDRVSAIPRSGPLADAAPADAQVVLVLGTG